MEEITQGRQFSSEQARVEVYLSHLLRLGSAAAAVLIGAGLLLLTLGSAGTGATLVTTGLIALVLTPVARVLVAMLVFLQERDYTFALICLIVLTAMALGVVLGRTH